MKGLNIHSSVLQCLEVAHNVWLYTISEFADPHSSRAGFDWNRVAVSCGKLPDKRDEMSLRAQDGKSQGCCHPRLSAFLQQDAQGLNMGVKWRYKQLYFNTLFISVPFHEIVPSLLWHEALILGMIWGGGWRWLSVGQVGGRWGCWVRSHTARRQRKNETGKATIRKMSVSGINSAKMSSIYHCQWHKWTQDRRTCILIENNLI